MEAVWGPRGGTGDLQETLGATRSPEETALHVNHTSLEEAQEWVEGFVSQVSITDLISSLLSTTAVVVEDVMYIVLFLVFM